MAKTPTLLDKIKEQVTQLDALKEEAKKEALERAETAIAELKELGFSYFLGGQEQSKAPRRKKTEGAKVARHTPSDTPCGYCLFKTDPLHDKRSHRSQTKKRAFNDKELEQLGMTRVA